MQTILRVVSDNRGQASMIDDYLAQFAARTASEDLSSEPPSFDSDNIAFIRDDVNELRDNCAELERTHLGSFRQLPNQAKSKTQLIFMNPIILLHRPNGQNLRLWVASTSSGVAEDSESV